MRILRFNSFTPQPAKTQSAAPHQSRADGRYVPPSAATASSRPLTQDRNAPSFERILEYLQVSSLCVVWASLVCANRCCCFCLQLSSTHVAYATIKPESLPQVPPPEPPDERLIKEVDDFASSLLRDDDDDDRRSKSIRIFLSKLTEYYSFCVCSCNQTS